jgi:hypothetical protein
MNALLDIPKHLPKPNDLFSYKFHLLKKNLLKRNWKQIDIS